MHRVIAYISFLLFSRAIFAQEQIPYPAQQLDTANINFSDLVETKTDSLTILSADDGFIPLTSAQWLSEQTAFQTRIYGAGMTAGLSLRGAPVSHVQVVWNGVSLNSPLNGQTDLNMLSAGLTEQITLYRGGMSQSFGSGAMAGALVMNDPLRFDDGAKLGTHLRTGNNGLHYGLLRWQQSGRHWSIMLGGDWEDNDNDFRIPSIGYINRNAHIGSRHFNMAVGYRRNENLWQTHFLHNFSDRYLPGTRTTVSHSRLLMEQTAWQFHWTRKKFLLGTLDIMGAAVGESYRYYHVAGQAVSGAGNAQNYQFRIAHRGHWGPLKAGIHYDFNWVQGQSLNFERHVRALHTLSADADWQYKNFKWHGGLRLQKTSGIPIPPTGFAGITWRPWGNYQTSLVYSTNFRLPTFNDLYWQPGGNPHLLPERNREWEWVHQWSSRSVYFRLAAYYRINRNLIRWTPGNGGLWHPVNMDRTRARGFEFSGRLKKVIGRWKTVLSAGYTYQDVVDATTGRQLSYTPPYLWTTALRLAYGGFYLRPQLKFQSYYYTDASNTYFAPQIFLLNLQAGWRYKKFGIDVEISNMLNTYYEWMPGRPMPGRSGVIGLTYDIHFKSNNKH